MEGGERKEGRVKERNGERREGREGEEGRERRGKKREERRGLSEMTGGYRNTTY